MRDPDPKLDQTPTPETVLRSAFDEELSDLADVADRIVSASRLTGGNVRQKRLRAIFEEAARG